MTNAGGKKKKTCLSLLGISGFFVMLTETEGTQMGINLETKQEEESVG